MEHEKLEPKDIGCLFVTVIFIGLLGNGCINLIKEELKPWPIACTGSHATTKIDNVDMVIRHTANSYTLLRQLPDGTVDTQSVAYSIPKYRVRRPKTPQNKVIADVPANEKPWAMQYNYDNGSRGFELHIHNVLEIKGGEHHYRVKIQKHWHDRVEQSDIIDTSKDIK